MNEQNHSGISNDVQNTNIQSEADSDSIMPLPIDRNDHDVAIELGANIYNQSNTDHIIANAQVEYDRNLADGDDAFVSSATAGATTNPYVQVSD